MRLSLLLLGLLLCGCVPTTVPPQLSATPGVSVTVTNNFIEFEGVEVTYPSGWRVITSAADSPLHFIFAAPQDEALIILSTSEMITLPQLDPEFETIYETTSRDGRSFHLWLIASPSSSEEVIPHFQNVLLSLTH